MAGLSCIQAFCNHLARIDEKVLMRSCGVNCWHTALEALAICDVVIVCTNVTNNARLKMSNKKYSILALFGTEEHITQCKRSQGYLPDMDFQQCTQCTYSQKAFVSIQPARCHKKKNPKFPKEIYFIEYMISFATITGHHAKYEIKLNHGLILPRRNMNHLLLNRCFTGQVIQINNRHSKLKFIQIILLPCEK